MKRILLIVVCFGFALSQSVFGQAPPNAGFGVMGVPPSGYPSTPPPSVPAYPNSFPPPSISPGVTAPPLYADPYAVAPPPGQVSNYTPQGNGAYGAPIPTTSNYGAPVGGQSSPNIVNFNSLEAFYRFVDPKAKGLKGAHTLGAELSVALFNPLYLKIGANWGSGSGGGGVTGATQADYDFASIHAGAGFHTSLIHDRLTFVTEVGLNYTSLKAKDSSLSFSDGSIYVRPALRFTPWDFMELQAGVTVSSADKYDSKMLDLSSYFRVLPMLDVGIGADFGDTTRAFRTAIRLRW